MSYWEIFEVPSESMLPTFRIGDLVLVDKSFYGTKYPWSDKIRNEKIPQYGDIIVFIQPQTSEYYVKRVIGLPGDVVMSIGQRVWVNGEPLELYDDNIDNSQMLLWEKHWKGTADIRRASVLDKKYNLLWSKNNRSWTFSGYWEVPNNSLFVLGDWRDESSDSRAWGFVPMENIVGKPVCLYDGGTRTGISPIKERSSCSINESFL